MTLIIAGERSGVGKTTVTLALLAVLKHRNGVVQSFKVGPDYIDPMFHQFITRRLCRNLDPVLTSPNYVQQCFAQQIQEAEFGLVEGVMGLFDGVRMAGLADFASTAHVARILQLPVVLVIDCSRLSGSVAAIAQGYRSFDPQVQIAGLILNRVGSDRHRQMLQESLEPLEIPILGVLPRNQEITLPDRHLGLVPASELPQLQRVVDQLIQVGEQHFDWQQLLPLLKAEKNRSVEPLKVRFQGKVKIAIAHDNAFSFYYADNLEILQQLGAELVYWSPIADPQLPPDIQGLYLGGGFPEMFAAQLSANHHARLSVQKAILSGLPTYAECGGLMYLCEEIQDFEGHRWEMVGIFPTVAQMGKRLTLGYRHATALQDSPMFSQGSQIWGHEFHRSQLSQPSSRPLFQLQGFHTPQSTEGWHRPNVHASYLHLHFGQDPTLPARFLAQCRQFKPQNCD